MNKSFTISACTLAASFAIGATTVTKRLTPQRLAELTAPASGGEAKRYKVEISNLPMPRPTQSSVASGSDVKRTSVKLSDSPSASVTFSADSPQAVLESIREFRFPTQFSPPKASADGTSLTAPTVPGAFEKVNTGWTVRVTAKQYGKLIALAGAADYVSAELVPGDYGSISGPIYNEKGEVLSPNKYFTPKIQTTTTHFQLFAVPGQPYEVIFHRGEKEEKHTITVTTE